LNLFIFIYQHTSMRATFVGFLTVFDAHGKNCRRAQQQLATIGVRDDSLQQGSTWDTASLQDYDGSGAVQYFTGDATIP